MSERCEVCDGPLMRPVGMVEYDEERFCSAYCAHNADGECACQPCVFLRSLK